MNLENCIDKTRFKKPIYVNQWISWSRKSAEILRKSGGFILIVCQDFVISLLLFNSCKDNKITKVN